MFGLDFPLFAFSHCRDVVAAVTNSGGLGVFGAASYPPDQLELELRWIDEHVGGKPYGIDIVMPAKYVGHGEVDPAQFREQFAQMIPAGHRAFVEDLLQEHHVADLADADEFKIDPSMSHEGAEQLLAVALQHPASLLVNALGPMPASVVERAHERGFRTAALVGSVRHAVNQVAQGVDLIIAQGTEAGGHCGEISTMVLVPDVVDAAGEVPVLAAGGIGTGRQIAAALALGAEGAWTGSIWLTTRESEVAAAVMENLLAAKAEDTVRSRSMTGKPCRQLRTAWTEAWESDKAPDPLPAPLQILLYAPAKERIEKAGARPLAGSAVGQIVGRMNQVRSARDVFQDLVSETIDATQRLDRLLGGG
jgi:NAD(P)H-dependent flavin oxidoreductase YrpB (nitropropane dioxygenase family)